MICSTVPKSEIQARRSRLKDAIGVFLCCRDLGNSVEVTFYNILLTFINHYGWPWTQCFEMHVTTW